MSPDMSPQGTVPILEAHNVWFHYDDGPPVLKGINLTIPEGRWLAIVGCNGSGKSTLVKHFNGLLRPREGEVFLAGSPTARKKVGELSRLVGYVPQNPDRLIFSPTVWEEIAFGPTQQGLVGPDLEERVAEALAQLDLTALREAPPATLGYGVRRKVALAAVLALRPRLLVLDEPTTGLDVGCIDRFMQAVMELHARGSTIVLISHDLDLVQRYASHVVLMAEGQILAVGETRAILTNQAQLNAAGMAPLPITHLAGLLASSPDNDFPADLLTPDEFVDAYLPRRRPEGAR